MDILKAIAERKITFDTCAIFNYITDTNTKKSDSKSASPSIVLFADMVKKIYEGQNMKFAISMKMYVNFPEMIKNDPALKNEPYYLVAEFIEKTYDIDPARLAAAYGLEYESRFYGKIVNNIIKKELCLNFVPEFGHGTCSASKAKYQKIVKKLASKYSGVLYDKIPNLSIGMTITAKVGNGAYPVTTLYKLAPTIPSEELLKIFLQIVFSIAVLQLYKAVHNDLHAGNVLVEERPAPIKLAYIAGGKRFIIETKYIPYLFDWDMSYCEILGPNMKITYSEFCEDMNICNKFSEKSDLYTLVCTLGFKIPGMEKYYTNISDDVKNVQNPSKVKIPLTPEQEADFRHLEPYYINNMSVNIYKVSGRKILSIVGNQYEDQIPTTTTSVLVYINPQKYLKIFRGFYCRPTLFDEKFPTPRELLENFFDQFVDYKTNVGERSSFQLPEIGFVRSLYRDPYISSTRYKISGQPRFPKTRVGTTVTYSPADI